MISWVDGQLVWVGGLACGSGCSVIAHESTCADLSQGGDRATGPDQGGACPTGRGDPSEVDDAARAGEAPRVDREGEEARRLANLAAWQGRAGLHQWQEGAGHR